MDRTKAGRNSRAGFCLNKDSLGCLTGATAAWLLYGLGGLGALDTWVVFRVEFNPVRVIAHVGGSEIRVIATTHNKLEVTKVCIQMHGVDLEQQTA